MGLFWREKLDKSNFNIFNYVRKHILKFKKSFFIRFNYGFLD